MGGKEQGSEIPSIIEQLLSKATSVDIQYVDGGFLGDSWFELSGKGRIALEELTQKFGQQGVDAFNKAFITPDFEQRIESRMARLTEDIRSTFDEAQSASDVAQSRSVRCAERDGLDNILRSLRRGEEVPIKINRREGEHHFHDIVGVRNELYFGIFPARDAVLINLKKPNPVIAKSS